MEELNCLTVNVFDSRCDFIFQTEGLHHKNCFGSLASAIIWHTHLRYSIIQVLVECHIQPLVAVWSVLKECQSKHEGFTVAQCPHSDGEMSSSFTNTTSSSRRDRRAHVFLESTPPSAYLSFSLVAAAGIDINHHSDHDEINNINWNNNSNPRLTVITQTITGLHWYNNKTLWEESLCGTPEHLCRFGT